MSIECIEGARFPLQNAILLGFCAMAVGGSAAPADPAALKESVRSYATNHDFNGTVLVQRRDDVLVCEAFGLANREFKIPAAVDTRYRIASITKLFTATLILQLVEEGRIDINAPVTNYLHSYRAGADLNVRSLLNHTSGLANPDVELTFDRATKEGIPLYQLPHTSNELLQNYASGPVQHKPGAHFDYNNADYVVLGKVIEAVTHESFEHTLQKRILSPLALHNSGVLRQRDIVDRLAPTYLRQSSGQQFIHDIPVLIENWYAAGAMFSTVEDLARFADALYSGRLLNPATLDEMLTPGLGEYGYGLWIWQQKREGGTFRAAVRFGGILGANGVVYRILADGITIVILGNTNATDIGAFADHLARAVLNAP